MTVAANLDKTVDYQGETYYFCSASCRAKFNDAPPKFVKRQPAPVAASTAGSAGVAKDNLVVELTVRV